MAEAGSFADRVKQQADIVRVIGEYVRLKKSGQNFSGLCPFHQEKTPSFSVSAVKQMYYCFGCGKGGDVFQFVMELEKAPFPEAVRTVAEKCGIAIPKPRERSPEERKENQQRSGLVDMHREAAAFFARHLLQTPEGKVAFAYLEDRGLNKEAVTRFGLGFAPSAGDALCRFLKQKYPENILEVSGLVGRDSDRAKKPPLSEPSDTSEELTPGDRVEGLGNFGRPTGEIGTIERANEEDAVVKWDDDGRMRLRQPWLKKVGKNTQPAAKPTSA